MRNGPSILCKMFKVIIHYHIPPPISHSSLSCLPHILHRYEKTIESGGSTHYSITGYASVYLYYAYPDKIRPRIRYYLTMYSVDTCTISLFSQMLIMPPYQRKGLGGM